MSVRQILKAKEILAVVLDSRKAEAIKPCFEGEISPMAPASILRTHRIATVYLDTNSAALLSPVLLTSDWRDVVSSESRTVSPAVQLWHTMQSAHVVRLCPIRGAPGPPSTTIFEHTRLLVIRLTLTLHLFVLFHHFLLHLLPFGLLVRC
jgi:hypothetical protein